jgi:hypothetical protein
MINYYFVIYLGHRNIALSFLYRPSLRFKAKFQHFVFECILIINLNFKISDFENKYAHTLMF